MHFNETRKQSSTKMSEAVLQKNTHMERKESYDSMQNFDTQLLEAIKWNSVEAFKNSLELKSDETRELEQKTREQRNSPEWFAANFVLHFNYCYY